MYVISGTSFKKHLQNYSVGEIWNGRNSYFRTK